MMLLKKYLLIEKCEKSFIIIHFFVKYNDGWESFLAKDYLKHLKENYGLNVN